MSCVSLLLPVRFVSLFTVSFRLEIIDRCSGRSLREIPCGELSIEVLYGLIGDLAVMGHETCRIPKRRLLCHANIMSACCGTDHQAPAPTIKFVPKISRMADQRDPSCLAADPAGAVDPARRLAWAGLIPIFVIGICASLGISHHSTFIRIDHVVDPYS